MPGNCSIETAASCHHGRFRALPVAGAVPGVDRDKNNVATAVAVPVRAVQAALIAITSGAVVVVAAGAPLASAVVTSSIGESDMDSGCADLLPR